MALCALLATSLARADDTIRIGLILTYSGPFADNARQIDDGIKLFIKQHGDILDGKKVEIIRRDTGGPAPELAKRLALELVVRDKVNFLTGFVLTPNALAAAEVSAQTKTPMVVMNATGLAIPTKSPYVVRVSFTLPQISKPLAEWAIKSGLRRTYTIVSDYGPGQEAEKSFQDTFEALGGSVIGSVRTPLRSPEFAPYIQRAQDTRPDAVFVFLPGGEQPVSIMRSFIERGFSTSGAKIIGAGEITDDNVLDSIGANALGVITSSHYSHEHASSLNEAFVRDFKADAGGRFPNYLAVGGYDGMSVIYEAVKRASGATDPDRVMKVLKGLRFESPRGPVEIESQSGDIVQNVYIRRVERWGDGVRNVEFETVPQISASGRSAKP